MAYATIQDFYEFMELDPDSVDATKTQKYLDRAFNQINSMTGTYYSSPVNDCTTITETLDPTILKTDIAQSYLVLSKYPVQQLSTCLLYTSPSPRDGLLSRMPSSA